jgi:hypothetical protein
MPIAVTKPCMSGTGCVSQQSVRLRFHMEDGTMVEAGKAATVPQDTTPGSWATNRRPNKA